MSGEGEAGTVEAGRVEAGTVLVVGASGVVGTAAVEVFLAERWDVIALSRRAPEVDSDRPLRHLPLDLRDAEACRAALTDPSLRAVTHVVYTAVSEAPGLVKGWRDPERMELNLAMLRNVLDPLCERGGLRHISLLQGTKAYGAHLHRIPVPARERLPRDPHDNFYWLHEDHIRMLAERYGPTFTIWRPQLIVGPNHGVVMNLPPIIGIYAAICREEGRPFAFPGGYPLVWEAVDTRLLARAMVWAASAPAAAGETFNVTNGEAFDFRTLWPALADVLGVEVGPDEPCRLATFLPERAEVWERIVARHDLRPITMPDLLGESHHYADLCFNYGRTRPSPPALVSTVKLKQAGFTEVCDTEESFRHWLHVLIDRRILPPA